MSPSIRGKGSASPAMTLFVFTTSSCPRVGVNDRMMRTPLKSYPESRSPAAAIAWGSVSFPCSIWHGPGRVGGRVEPVPEGDPLEEVQGSFHVIGPGGLELPEEVERFAPVLHHLD